MNLTNTKILILTLGLLTLVGCKPPAKSGVRTYTSSTRTDIVYGSNNNPGSSLIQNNCPQNQSATGAIYDPTGYSNNSTQSFEERVKLFLSATVQPGEIGSISNGSNDSTGIRFQGTVKLDQAGRVVLAQSKVAIKIYDSIAIQSSPAKPIPVTISTASSGQFNLQTGIGYIIFKDQFGEIRFDGKIDAQYFSGAVSYSNYKTVVTNAALSSGYLGQFYITTCGMIQ